MLNARYLNSDSLKWITYGDAEPVNIDLALAQIAEMESAENTLDRAATDDIVLAEVYSLREKLKIAASIIHQLDPNYDVAEFLHQVGSADYDQREEDLTPLTWNERINQMTVEEKARWLLVEFPKLHKKSYDYAWKNRKMGEFSRYYTERMSELLNSAAEVGK